MLAAANIYSWTLAKARPAAAPLPRHALSAVLLPISHANARRFVTYKQTSILLTLVPAASSRYTTYIRFDISILIS